MRILTFTVADVETGSTKYRVSQYKDALAARGIELELIHRDDLDSSTIEKAGAADAVLNQKCLFKAGLARKIIKAARRAYFDFDDAVYTRPGKPYSLPTQLRVDRRLRTWYNGADQIIAANNVLGDHARRFTDKVTVIPMALDMSLWKPAEQRAPGPIRIGWAGSPVNLCNVERLEPVLARVLEEHREVELHIYSGGRPNISISYTHVPFSPATEADFVRNLDIGLLPLVDEPHARGKSPIKSIQYISCAVPCVGNVVGATTDILSPENSIAVESDDDWVAALGSLINDESLRARLGAAGRQHAEAAFAFERCLDSLETVLRGG